MQDNMEDVELVIRGKRIVGDKHIFSGYICIRDGKIVSVSEEGFDGTKWKSCEVNCLQLKRLVAFFGF